MRGKLLFAAGLAVGYLLGTRAGRKRYEQIRDTAAKVWESEPVARQREALGAFVRRQALAALSCVTGALGRLVGVSGSSKKSAAGRKPAPGSGTAATAPAPTAGAGVAPAASPATGE